MTVKTRLKKNEAPDDLEVHFRITEVVWREIRDAARRGGDTILKLDAPGHDLLEVKCHFWHDIK